MTELRVSFPSETAARTAVSVLTNEGIDPEAITLTISAPAGVESSFIVRLVVAIALWSVAGAAAGIGLGVLTWLIVGPEGTSGLIIQAIVWGIFGHLILGLWAGYLLLADRTERDLPHDRAAESVLLIVRCADEGTLVRAREIVSQRGGEI